MVSSHALPACIRTCNDDGFDWCDEFEIERHDFVAAMTLKENRVTRLDSRTRASPEMPGDFRGFRRSIGLLQRGNQAKQEVHRRFKEVPYLFDLCREIRQDADDLSLFFELQLGQRVVQIECFGRLDEHRRSARGTRMDESGTMVLVFCLDGNNHPAITSRYDLFLQKSFSETLVRIEESRLRRVSAMEIMS